ncbi:hypothetical protein T492DRAFT_916539, partial [Pavlovales sp. CCMP2436]
VPVASARALLFNLDEALGQGGKGGDAQAGLRGDAQAGFKGDGRGGDEGAAQADELEDSALLPLATACWCAVRCAGSVRK